MTCGFLKNCCGVPFPNNWSMTRRVLNHAFNAIFRLLMHLLDDTIVGDTIRRWPGRHAANGKTTKQVRVVASVRHQQFFPTAEENKVQMEPTITKERGGGRWWRDYDVLHTVATEGGSGWNSGWCQGGVRVKGGIRKQVLMQQEGADAAPVQRIKPLTLINWIG